MSSSRRRFSLLRFKQIVWFKKGTIAHSSWEVFERLGGYKGLVSFFNDLMAV